MVKKNGITIYYMVVPLFLLFYVLQQVLHLAGVP